MPDLTGVCFALLLHVSVQISQSGNKAGKFKCWTSKPHIGRAFWVTV